MARPDERLTSVCFVVTLYFNFRSFGETKIAACECENRLCWSIVPSWGGWGEGGCTRFSPLEVQYVAQSHLSSLSWFCWQIGSELESRPVSRIVGV